MQQGLLFAAVVDGVNGITMFVSVRVHNGRLAISSPLLAHTAPIYADAAGAVAGPEGTPVAAGEAHVNADGAVLAEMIELWSGGQDGQ